MITSEKLREEQKKYNEDLRERTLRVPCPRCRAAANEPCEGRFGPVKYRHIDRADEAKRQGFIKGKP